MRYPCGSRAGSPYGSPDLLAGPRPAPLAGLGTGTVPRGRFRFAAFRPRRPALRDRLRPAPRRPRAGATSGYVHRADPNPLARGASSGHGPGPGGTTPDDSAGASVTQEVPRPGARPRPQPHPLRAAARTGRPRSTYGRANRTTTPGDREHPRGLPHPAVAPCPKPLRTPDAHGARTAERTGRPRPATASTLAACRTRPSHPAVAPCPKPLRTPGARGTPTAERTGRPPAVVDTPRPSEPSHLAPAPGDPNRLPAGRRSPAARQIQPLRAAVADAGPPGEPGEPRWARRRPPNPPGPGPRAPGPLHRAEEPQDGRDSAVVGLGSGGSSFTSGSAWTPWRRSA